MAWMKQTFWKRLMVWWRLLRLQPEEAPSNLQDLLQERFWKIRCKIHENPRSPGPKDFWLDCSIILSQYGGDSQVPTKSFASLLRKDTFLFLGALYLPLACYALMSIQRSQRFLEKDKNQTKGKRYTDEKHKKSKSERTWSDTELDRGHSSSPSNRLVFHRTFGGTRNSEVGFIYRTRASMCRTAWTGDTDSPSLETLVVPLADKTALWITTHISWVIFNSYMS